MIEKDYFTRLIKTLFEALYKIKSKHYEDDEREKIMLELKKHFDSLNLEMDMQVNDVLEVIKSYQDDEVLLLISGLYDLSSKFVSDQNQSVDYQNRSIVFKEHYVKKSKNFTF